MHRPKHYEYATENAIGATSQAAVFVDDLVESLNIHGLRGDLCLATSLTSRVVVNWALVCVPEIVNLTDVGIGDDEFNDESIQSMVWASGKRLVDFNNVEHIEVLLGTSRNCEKGMQIALLVRNEEVISGVTPTITASAGFTWWETQT